MAELVELGFEGMNKFADKYWDTVYDNAKKHKPQGLGKRGRKGHPNQDRPYEDRSRQDRSHHGYSHQDLPPYPPSSAAPPQHGSYHPPSRARFDESESESGREGSKKKDMYGAYVSDRRRDDWRDDGYEGGEAYGYDVSSDQGYNAERGERSSARRDAPGQRRDGGLRNDGGYQKGYGYEAAPDRGHKAGTGQQLVARDRDVGRDAYAYRNAGTVMQQPPPPLQYANAGRGAMAANARPKASRRGSSWSPPRSSDREKRGPPRRARSKSPSHYRAGAAVAGAVAGGFAGSRLKEGSPVANSVTTVVGAVIGSLGAAQAEKGWERHKEKRREEEEREERRERRRKEKRERGREYN